MHTLHENQQKKRLKDFKNVLPVKIQDFASVLANYHIVFFFLYIFT